MADENSRRFPRALSAVIFDLDGVLTDTAALHYRAWKRLADELGLPFSIKGNARLKGIDRHGSLALILGDAASRFSTTEIDALAERKNGWYRDSIADLTPRDVLPGAREALAAAKAAGLRTALASASRNAAELIRRLELESLLDHQVDAATIHHGKPAPDIFLAAADALGMAPKYCIGVEDAAAGIEAINAAGMASLGVGDRVELSQAWRVIGDMTEFRLDDYAMRNVA